MNADLYPLRQDEILLKQYFKDNNIPRFEQPMDYEDFEGLIHRSPLRANGLIMERISYIIKEDQFFSSQTDVTAFMPMRYLPPCLHRSDFFELAFVLDGEFTYFLSDKSFTMRRGDITILAPNIPHCSYTCQDEGIQINVLIRASTFEEHFMSLIPHDDLLHSFFANALYSSSGGYCLEFFAGEDEELEKMLLNLLEESTHNHRYKDTMLIALISAFFVALIRKHETHVRLPGRWRGNLNENTIMMIEYMQKNYTAVNLRHLAEFFNYSERQAQRLILAATGKTFKENITMLKMRHACELLTDTSRTVTDIAGDLGFFDVSHFRRTFSAFYGMTPSAYRKSACK